MVPMVSVVSIVPMVPYGVCGAYDICGGIWCL